MSNKWLIIIILGVSILTHFIFFGHPKETVFDEVHFGKFVSGYYTHQYFFDIHPPLGKLMIAGFGKLFDFNPSFSFANIGDKFPDNKYMALRFLPTLAGALLPVIIFLLALQLGFSKTASFCSAIFVVLESGLLVQSRLILMDAFLLLFGFSALLFYFKFRKDKHWKNLLWFGIMGGLSASVKWTGIAFIGLPAVIELFFILRDSHFKKLINLALFFVVTPFVVYFSIFTIHFSLLTKSGPGDAFMTLAFQKTLAGSIYEKDPSLKTPNLISKFFELNYQLYDSNRRLTATHPYSSKFYTWPFMIRPIYYWIGGDTPGTSERIYFIGNPFLWWASTVAVIFLIFYSIFRPKTINQTSIILFVGYIINYLPFVGIGRVMFLYHYLAALIFAILILAYVIDQFKNKVLIFGGLLFLFAVSFIYFAPFTYGLKLSPASYQEHIWLKSWE